MGGPIPEQLLGGLVGDTTEAGRVVLFVVQVQHASIRATGLPAHLGDAPLFLLPRLEFVFLSIWRTVSKEMLPANSSSTTWSASRWSVQGCPSGGLLHAMATRCASCLPLNLRSRPGRGRSLMAASSPSSTNRLRALATVRALTETASAASRSDSPSGQLSATQGPALPCGPTACPGGIPQSGPLGWCQFDFVLGWQAISGYGLLGRSYPSLLSLTYYSSLLRRGGQY